VIRKCIITGQSGGNAFGKVAIGKVSFRVSETGVNPDVHKRPYALTTL
jgi:hypothetical protein